MRINTTTLTVYTYVYIYIYIYIYVFLMYNNDNQYYICICIMDVYTQHDSFVIQLILILVTFCDFSDPTEPFAFALAFFLLLPRRTTLG